MISEFFIGFILLLVGITLLMFITKGHKAIKENAKQTMYLALSWAIGFLVCNFLVVYFDFLDVNSLWVLIGHQGVALCLGIGFILSLYRFLPWAQKELHVHELLLALTVPLIVAGLQILVFKRVPKVEDTFIVNFVPSFIFFIVPLLAVKSFVFMMKIPEAKVEHQTWVYPVNEDIDEPSHEMKDIIPINIAVNKSINDKNKIVIRANAPVKMKFGDFYYFVIEDYNLKNAQEPIYFADQYDQPYKWYFNIDPKWYETIRYINPDLTIEANKIGDNRKISCNRLTTE
jgi:hypothetical protein